MTNEGKQRPSPIFVGDYVLTPPNMGCDPRSFHTARVARIIAGNPQPSIILFVDSSSHRIVLHPDEIAFVSYEDASW